MKQQVKYMTHVSEREMETDNEMKERYNSEENRWRKDDGYK